MLYSRCPWCGEIVRQISHYKIRIFHCPGCDMPVKSKDTELRISGLLPIFQQPYVKITSHYVPQKCAECKIIWNDKIKHPQLNLIEGIVLIICFTDEFLKPISHNIAVCLETLNFADKNKTTANLSFVVNGKLDNDYKIGTKFLLFDDKSVIGNGVLTEDIHFPQFNKM